ncbi:hypothetical protein N9E20_02190 [Crocinitomicaceae bacterium]|nr:hypothetical protein [Crocinitomicaceae bacterium]
MNRKLIIPLGIILITGILIFINETFEVPNLKYFAMPFIVGVVLLAMKYVKKKE